MANKMVSPVAVAAFRKALEQYAPGGGFMSGVEQGLARSRTKAVSQGASALVSAGLAGTTSMAGLGKRFEEEVGAPTRASAESQRVRELSGIWQNIAGMEQGAYENAMGRNYQTALQNLSGRDTFGASSFRSQAQAPSPAQQPKPTTHIGKIPSPFATSSATPIKWGTPMIGNPTVFGKATSAMVGPPVPAGYRPPNLQGLRNTIQQAYQAYR